jgi:hypothetical protein
VCAVAAVLLTGRPAHAQLFWGAKPMAMGGAFSAVANDVNAIQWNPAGLTALTQRKQMGFDLNYEHHEYLFGDFPYLHPELTQAPAASSFGSGYFNNTTSNVNPKQKERDDWYHIGIADGYVNPLVAVGTAVTSMNFSNSTLKRGNDYDVDLSVAGGFPNVFSIGGTGRWINFSETGKGKADMDIGMLINAINIIKVGLVGRNLFGNDQPLLVRREVSLGVAGYVMSYATISVEMIKVFDGLEKLSSPEYKPPGTFNFAVGAEGVVVKVLAIRGGFNWDQLSGSRMYSGGLAYVDPHGTLGYTFQGSVDQVRDFTHSIQMTLYFP